MDVFSQVGTSCSHPCVCTCRGGSCALLLSQPGFLHPIQMSFTPTPCPCSAEAGQSHQQPPLSICVHLFPCLSFPHLPHPPPTARGLLPAGRGPASPTLHPTLLPPRPPKIPPLCPTLHWASVSFLHPLPRTQLNNLVPPGPATSFLSQRLGQSATGSVSPPPDGTKPQDMPPAAVKGLRLDSN